MWCECQSSVDLVCGMCGVSVSPVLTLCVWHVWCECQPSVDLVCGMCGVSVSPVPLNFSPLSYFILVLKAYDEYSVGTNSTYRCLILGDRFCSKHGFTDDVAELFSGLPTDLLRMVGVYI